MWRRRERRTHARKIGDEDGIRRRECEVVEDPAIGQGLPFLHARCVETRSPWLVHRGMLVLAESEEALLFHDTLESQVLGPTTEPLALGLLSLGVIVADREVLREVGARMDEAELGLGRYH